MLGGRIFGGHHATHHNGQGVEPVFQAQRSHLQGPEGICRFNPKHSAGSGERASTQLVPSLPALALPVSHRAGPAGPRVWLGREADKGTPMTSWGFIPLASLTPRNYVEGTSEWSHWKMGEAGAFAY